MRILGNRPIVIGLIILIVGGLLAYKKWFTPHQAPTVPDTTGPVVFAKQNLLPRTVITKEMLEVKRKEKKEIPAGVLTSIDAAVGSVVGPEVIEAGTMIDKEMLAGKLKDVGLAYLIPPFMRAMVLEMASEPSFHNQIRVGNRVDIIATFDDQYTRTLVEDVEVLAVDNVVDPYSLDIRGQYTDEAKRQRKAYNQSHRDKPMPEPPPPPPSIVLAVRPEDAEALSLAVNTATLDFILRPMSPEQVVIEAGAPAGEGGPVPAGEGASGRQKAFLAQHKGITLDELAPPLAKKSTAPPRPVIYNPPRAAKNIPSVPPQVLTPPPKVEVKTPPPQPKGHQIEIITGSEHRTVTVPEPGI